MVAAACGAPALDSRGILCGDTPLRPAKLCFWVKDVLLAVLGTVRTGFIVSTLLSLVQRPTAVLAIHNLTAPLPYIIFFIIADKTVCRQSIRELGRYKKRVWKHPNPLLRRYKK